MNRAVVIVTLLRATLVRRCYTQSARNHHWKHGGNGVQREVNDSNVGCARDSHAALAPVPGTRRAPTRQKQLLERGHGWRGAGFSGAGAAGAVFAAAGAGPAATAGFVAGA